MTRPLAKKRAEAPQGQARFLLSAPSPDSSREGLAVTPIPVLCPNPACTNHHAPVREVPFYWHRGKFARRDGLAVRRFQCKDCGAWFSEQTFRPTYRAKKAGVVAAVARLRRRGVSIRATARLLGINRKTAVRHARALSAAHVAWPASAAPAGLRTGRARP